MIVIDDKTIPAGVRAIVIGVGKYPLTGEYRIGDLTSAGLSALAFARWLLEEFNYPGKPLKYLDVLVSPAAATNGDLLDGHRQAIRKRRPEWDFELCSMDALEAAIEGWAEEGLEAKGDVTVFYFCGHGVERRGVMALLAEDFDAKKRKFVNSLDLRKFHAGTANFRARDKYFFIDACRSVPGRLGPREITPRPVIEPDLDVAHTGEAPIFLATLSGANAYGDPDAVSQFTDALLRGLRGAGAEMPDGAAPGPWVVTGLTLEKGIDKIMKIRDQLGQLKNPQKPFMSKDTPANKAFHVFKPGIAPKVPLLLFWTCGPAHVVLEAAEHAPMEARNSPMHTMEYALKPRSGTVMATIKVARANFQGMVADPPAVLLYPPAIWCPLTLSRSGRP